MDPEEELEGLMDRGQEGPVNPQHPRFPMSWMEIPTFEGVNSQWWLRKCEKMFEWYGIPERQRAPLAAAYFNDVV